MATKDLKHSIHVLRKQIQDLDGSIEEQQQRLTDLSVEVGTLFDLELGILTKAIQRRTTG